MGNRRKWHSILLIGLALLLASSFVGCAKPPVINQFDVSPTQISAGESATLLWNVTRATTVTIDQGIGNISAIGTKKVSPTKTIAYTLTATNSAGPVTKAVVITVKPPTQPPPAHFTTYTDEIGLFSISYPLNWKTFPSSMWPKELEKIRTDFLKYYDSNVELRGFFIVFYAEAPTDSQVRANVNVVVQPSSELKGTLDEIVEAKLQRTKEIEQEYHEFSRVNTIIDGREVIIVDWGSSFPTYGKKSRCVQMFTLVHKFLWKVTCYVDSQQFSYCQDDLYAIVRSLRILK